VANCCARLPVLILSQDPDRPKPGWSAQSVAAQPIWNSLQEGLKRLSPHSRRVIARKGGHHIMIDRPEVVADGTRQLVAEIRTGTPNRDEGTTVVR
jgi:pimeloyl-ACP methyl ester carboxylesterase